MSKDVVYFPEVIHWLGSEKLIGWYFWNETGQPVGPYKTEWDAELVLTAYCLHYQGVGDQNFLYLDLEKFLTGRTKK